MDFFKKLSFASYILIGSAALALAALIIGGVSSAGEGFGMDEMPIIIVFTLLAVLLIGGTVFTSAKFGEKPWISALVIAAVLFIALSMFNMLMGKTDVMGTVMFSDLEKGYKPAEDACYIGLASIVIYIISALTAAVCAFFKLSKEIK